MIHLKRLWCWERLKAGGEGDDRGWDGWMASLTQRTWVWGNSGSCWWTGKSGVLQSMGSQRVRHNWVTEMNWTEFMESNPTTSWKIEGGNKENSDRFIFWRGAKITADGDCGHEIKRCLLLGRKAMTNISSVHFSHSVVFNSLWPHEPQHARPPCPSPTPGVYPNSCPLSQWCHPIILSSVVPFFSCPQSFPTSGSF